MRILVLGAGATGGYYGGRLAQHGADVTFLVRPARAAALRRCGATSCASAVRCDADFDVAHVTAEALPARLRAEAFDLVLLACKAYDLDAALEAIAPAMHAGAALLDARFGAAQVPGGLCAISAVQEADGTVRQLGTLATMTFGERDGAPPRAQLVALSEACTRAGIEHVVSTRIAQAQWLKFAFLAALAAGTCLMRAPVGDIVASDDGRALMEGLYAECVAVAEAAGEPIDADARRWALAMLTQADSPMTASMLRDLQVGQRVEAAHIVGDMLARARAADLPAPRLAVAWAHLQAYEARRDREAAKVDG